MVDKTPEQNLCNIYSVQVIFANAIYAFQYVTYVILLKYV